MKAKTARKLSKTGQTSIGKVISYEFIMKARQAETAEGQQLLPPAKGLWRSFRRPALSCHFIPFNAISR